MDMKVVVLFVLVITGCKPERIIVHTKSYKKSYNFFPLRTNYLEFSVRAKNDVHIALTNGYSLDLSYYEIIFGYEGNAKSMIRRDGLAENEAVYYNGTLARDYLFQTYWVYINLTEGSISAGMEYNKPLLHFQDPNFVRMSYFGIATGPKSMGVWNFDFGMLNCLCNKEWK